MKTRTGFVSNSSSTSFIITNKTDKDLTLVKFVKENIHLLDKWNKEYSYDDSLKELLLSAKENNFTFKAKSSEAYTFGDEDGTLIGRIFDYILREGGSSESFTWNFSEYYR